MFYELAGHSRSLYSINYERRLYKRNQIIITLRGGIGYTPGLIINNIKSKGFVSMPVVLSEFYGRRNHFLAVGVGYTSTWGENSVDSSVSPPQIFLKHESALIFKVGYRYLNIDGASIELYPLLEWTNNPNQNWILGFGLAFGYNW